MVILTQGCFVEMPVPSGNPFTGAVGEPDSKAQLKKGISTEVDAMRLFGDTYWKASSKAVIGYRGLAVDKLGLWLPILIRVHGGSIQPIHREYALFLHFGKDGLLDDYEVFKEVEHYDSSTKAEFTTFCQKYGAVPTIDW
jgi:hypothetical protein